MYPSLEPVLPEVPLISLTRLDLRFHYEFAVVLWPELARDIICLLRVESYCALNEQMLFRVYDMEVSKTHRMRCKHLPVALGYDI